MKETECEPIEIESINVHPNVTQTTMITPNNNIDINVFCYAALTNKQQGTPYTNAMGALPSRSLDAHQYFFVEYDYNNNYIFAEPIPNVKDNTIVDTFQRIFNILVEKGHRPLLNITDNLATVPLKAFLESKQCK